MTPLLLSKRQAAKLLGIGRDKLAALIRDGHVHTVNVLGRDPKISREECERFAREGCGCGGCAPPKRRSAIDAVRALRSQF